MAIRDFDAHEWKRRPVKVTFETRKGETVSFVAQKEQRVPVHVRFRTRNHK